jgi:hypothetical protein
VCWEDRVGGNILRTKGKARMGKGEGGGGGGRGPKRRAFI